MTADKKISPFPELLPKHLCHVHFDQSVTYRLKEHNKMLNVNWNNLDTSQSRYNKKAHTPYTQHSAQRQLSWWHVHFISRAQRKCHWMSRAIDQFRYIKIQPKTIDLSTRLLGINPTNSVFIPTSLVLRSIVLGWILIYRNWSTPFAVHLQKTNIHLCPNLFHFGQYTLINTNVTFICP